MDDPTPTEVPTVRRRLADVRATIVGTKGLRTKVARQTSGLATLRARVDTLRERADRQEQRLKDIEALARDVRRATELDAAERERRDAQLGAVEVRLADLEQRVDDVLRDASATPPDAEQVAAGRTLLDEVRAEHARIRVRMQVVSSYEERLRRVEESVAEVYEGDLRHPV